MPTGPTSNSLYNKLAFNGYHIVSTYQFLDKIRSIPDTLINLDQVQEFVENFDIDKTLTVEIPSPEDLGNLLINDFLAVSVSIWDNDNQLLWTNGI